MLELRVHDPTEIEAYVQRLFASVERLHLDLVGAYSCLTVTERDLFGAKEVAFASESSVFNYFGDYHDIREAELWRCHSLRSSPATTGGLRLAARVGALGGQK